MQDLTVQAGAWPRVEFSVDGAHQVVDCRLVVGADGRASGVRRRLGLPVEQVPATHLMSGLLVDRADGWPLGADALGTVGDQNFISLPQGDGLVRLYICHPLDTAARFAGPDGARQLIEAFAMACFPDARGWPERYRPGRAAPSAAEERWCPSPFTTGVVLIGDAAGYGDPIVGQGLSHAARASAWWVRHCCGRTRGTMPRSPPTARNAWSGCGAPA